MNRHTNQDEEEDGYGSIGEGKALVGDKVDDMTTGTTDKKNEASSHTMPIPKIIRSDTLTL